MWDAMPETAGLRLQAARQRLEGRGPFHLPAARADAVQLLHGGVPRAAWRTAGPGAAVGNRGGVRAGAADRRADAADEQNGLWGRERHLRDGRQAGSDDKWGGVGACAPSLHPAGTAHIDPKGADVKTFALNLSFLEWIYRIYLDYFKHVKQANLRYFLYI